MIGSLCLLVWLCVRCVVMLLVLQPILAVMFAPKDRLRAGPNLLGSERIVWHVVQVLRRWGRLPWWGGLRTPRYHGPLG